MCYTLKFFAPAAGGMYYHFKFLGACGGLHALHLKIFGACGGLLLYLIKCFCFRGTVLLMNSDKEKYFEHGGRGAPGVRDRKNASSTEGAKRPECETEKNF